MADIDQAITDIENAEGSLAAAKAALRDEPPPPPPSKRKSYAWWTRNNPGQAVVDLAAKYADTDSPLRRMPHITQGQQYFWNEDKTELTWKFDDLPGHIEGLLDRNGVDQLAASGGRLMLDQEAVYNVLDHGQVIHDMLQAQEIAKTTLEALGFKDPIGGTYPNPHHHFEGAANLTAALAASTGGFVAIHTRSGKRLQDLADLCHQVGPNVYDWTLYSWVFTNPPADAPPMLEPSIWQAQSGGWWVPETDLREQVQEALTMWEHPQISVRGKDNGCARALEIVREEILAHE